MGTRSHSSAGRARAIHPAAHLTLGSGPSLVWDKPWIPASALGRCDTLGQPGWPPRQGMGCGRRRPPPSFSGGAAPAVPFTTPGGAWTMASDSSTSFQFGVQDAGAADAGSVAWHVADPGPSSGVTVSPASGTFMVTGGRADVSRWRWTPGRPGTSPSSSSRPSTEGGTPLPDLTLDVDVCDSSP